MRVFRSARWLLLTLFLSLLSVSSHSQIVISVGFAPPELPVYVQPVCPEPNLMWTPGYWAYSNDDGDYYWVPGAWEMCIRDSSKSAPALSILLTKQMRGTLYLSP